MGYILRAEYTGESRKKKFIIEKENKNYSRHGE